MKVSKKYFLYAIILFTFWEIFLRLFRKTFPHPAPAIIGPALDSNLRRLFQPAGKLLSRSGIKPGMKILEIGCGSGCFTTYAARITGETGELNALDINPHMLSQLQKKINRTENADLVNIRIHLSSAYELPFQDNSLDLVFMVTVFPEIADKQKALAEIQRVLKPGGTLAISEFLPDPDYLTSATTIKLVESTGFSLDKIQGNFWNYTARFSK